MEDIDMITVLNYLKEKLLYPFKHDLLYFILLWGTISLPAFYQKLAYPEYFSLTLVLIFYAVTYILVFLLNLNQYAAKILKPIVFVLYTILSIVNVYCIDMYNCWFSCDFIRIIKETNIGEIREYIETYMSLKIIILVVFLFTVAIVVYKLTASIKLKIHSTVVSMACIPLLVFPIKICQHPDVLELYDFTWSFDDIVDLRNHLSHPNIVSMFSYSPEIAIIVGESFTPSHSSLYGYEKPTNPLLLEKQRSGNLVVFHKVTSPHTHTSAVFRYLLNTYLLGMETQCKWYESVNLIEVLNAVGYHTTWFSNQESKGLNDNLPSGHAIICDESIFMVKGIGGHKYDGELVKYEISQKERPSVVFYHLMGQHIRFQDRYPVEYDKFERTDYPEYGDDVAHVIAEYDNATLYNDYVVNSLIEKYQDENAVVLYFSDHGQDIFETDPNYFGHAKNTPESQIVGKKIPFMVYLSPKYQQLYPEATARIKSSTDKEFCTDKLIYAVMDAIGCKFADNNDVAEFSLFARK